MSSLEVLKPQETRDLGFENALSIAIGIAPKFIKPTTINPKLNFVATAPKGKLVFTSLPPSFRKVNISPCTTSSYYANDGLLFLPICFFLIFITMVSMGT